MKKLALVCHRNARLSFVFEAAQAAGIELVLIHDATEEAPRGLPAVTDTWCLPVFDAPDAALEAFVAGVQARGIGGVMTVREEAIIWTARAARRIGTPGIPPRVAALARNKYAMRRAFAHAGLRTPGFVLVSDPTDCAAALALGLPLVVKPLSGWSSTGVMLAQSAEQLPDLVKAVWAVQTKDLARFYDQSSASESSDEGWGDADRLDAERFDTERFDTGTGAASGVAAVDGDGPSRGVAGQPSVAAKRGVGPGAQRAAAGLVVEQYLPGREFVVECFVDHDGVHIMAVGDKGQPEGPWFEETIYRQRRDLDNPLVRALCASARAGVEALGIIMGAAHVELRLDAYDHPYVIEIGARIGGSGVSHFVVEQGTGVSLVALCMRAALGLPNPALPPALPAEKVAANYIIPLRGAGHFKGYVGLDQVLAHPETARVVTFFEAGHLVPPPPAFGGYPGFIFSVHASDAAARAYHAWLDQVLRIEWEPVIAMV